MKPKCSACLKETDIEEFLNEGGLCKNCSKKIDEIYLKEGADGVRRYYRRKREEAIRRME